MQTYEQQQRQWTNSGGLGLDRPWRPGPGTTAAVLAGCILVGLIANVASQQSPPHAIATNAAEAATLGPSDLSAMEAAGKENEVRYMQQYAGKVFEGAMPLRDISAVLSPKAIILYFDILECVVKDRQLQDRAAVLRKGELINVRGTVSAPFWSVYLTPCSFVEGNPAEPVKNLKR